MNQMLLWCYILSGTGRIVFWGQNNAFCEILHSCLPVIKLKVKPSAFLSILTNLLHKNEWSASRSGRFNLNERASEPVVWASKSVWVMWKDKKSVVKETCFTLMFHVLHLHCFQAFKQFLVH